MSDSESTHQPDAHPTLGGKSLQSFERPRYRSWRKKYRKMRSRFDDVLEENKRRFKEEHKLEAIAKRLREELDGLLELCLDFNQNPSVPPELRFNIDYPDRKSIGNVVPANISPVAANQLLGEYKAHVQAGSIPPLDLHLIREQIEQRLAVQDVRALAALESSVSHPILPPSEELSDELKGDELPGFLTGEQEADYLLRLDLKTDHPFALQSDKDRMRAELPEDKHVAELTPRELTWQVEQLNPQSQHNWLKQNAKLHADGTAGIDDVESLANHETKNAAPRKRGAGGGAKGSLAKQVGDRAVERAREGFSPGAASGVFGDDEVGVLDDHILALARKKGNKDPMDGAYRVKGGKSGAGAKGGKRKRTSDETTASTGSAKKARTEVAGGATDA